MPPASSLHPVVVASREHLLEGRAKLRQQHDSGSPGLQVCARWTDLVDAVLIDLVRTILEDLPIHPLSPRTVWSLMVVMVVAILHPTPIST